jgi:hypothetical protein
MNLVILEIALLLFDRSISNVLLIVFGLMKRPLKQPIWIARPGSDFRLRSSYVLTEAKPQKNSGAGSIIFLLFNFSMLYKQFVNTLSPSKAEGRPMQRVRHRDKKLSSGQSQNHELSLERFPQHRRHALYGFAITINVEAFGSVQRILQRPVAAQIITIFDRYSETQIIKGAFADDP